MTNEEFQQLVLDKLEQNDKFQMLVLEHMAKLTQDIANLKTGQDELRVGQDELRVGQDELRVGQDELRVGQDELRQAVARIEHQHGEKLAALFDAHSVYMDYFASLKDSQAKIEETLDIVFERQFSHETKLSDHDRELRLIRIEKKEG